MSDGQKYLRLYVSDTFILYTNRKDNIFGNFVMVGGLRNTGKFENFEERKRESKYKFQSGIVADVFYETMNSVMDYQDGLRHCIAPIDYRIEKANEPDDNWVKSSEYIGPYIKRKIKGRTVKYDRETELDNMRAARGYVAFSPKTEHIILDTAQINKNGIYYVYNLLIKPEDINSGYNPRGLATVEIASFVSDDDAEDYAINSQFFKDVAKDSLTRYNEYVKINERRIKMFQKITSNMKSDER